MKVKEVKVRDNRRELKEVSVNKLIDSIKEVGLINPITVDNEGYLIAGNHRLEAFKRLGKEEIPVNILALGLKRSRLAELHENLIRNEDHFLVRDKDLLECKNIYLELYPETAHGKTNGQTSKNDKMSSLENKSFADDTADKIGVTKKTIERSVKRAKEVTDNESKILQEANVNKGDVDAFIKQPEPIRAKVLEKLKEGGKFKSLTSVIKGEVKNEKIEKRLENNKELPSTVKIFNGDSTEVLKQLTDKSIDCVLTDPPYAIDFNHSWTGEKIKNDETDVALEILEKVCQQLVLKCKDDAHLYFFSGWVKIAEFKTIIEKYFDISNILVWVKNNTSLVDFDKRYAFKYENIFFCKQKGNKERVLANKQSPDVLTFNRLQNTNHPTEKPVDLLEYLVKNSTVENETVLDCFMGSGSTGEACLNNNRSFIGIEFDKKHFDYAETRLER